MTTGGHQPARWIRRHFHGVGYVLIVLLVGANMPSSLYGVYREEFGFSPTVQTLVFAVYALALVPALLLFGPLSDAVGRRPVLAVALLFGAMGAVLMATADSTFWLFAGRVAQGLSVGTCSAAGAAALVEHEPDGDHSRAAVAATATTAAGAAAGPLLAGLVAEYLPAGGTSLPYYVFLCTLVPAVVALALLPAPARSATGTAGGGRTAVRIRLPHVPKAVRTPFALAVAAAAAAWAVVGLFQAVVPSWITELLGVDNLAVGAAVAALVMLCSAVVQISARALPYRPAQRIGLVLLLLGMAGLLVVGRTESLPLLFVTTAVVGCGHGLAFAGGMRQINHAVSVSAPEAHGAVLATFYTVTYAGLGLPAVGAGLLVTHQGMAPALNEFSVAAAAACVLILALNLRSGRAVGPTAGA